MNGSDWIEGQPASAGALRALALGNHGHFTSIQVRNGAARGLDLHLLRLCEASAELFDHHHDPDALRAQLRQALCAAELADCTLRATVFAPDADPLRDRAGQPKLLVSLSPPLEPPVGPLRLRAVGYRRTAPHLKHTGTFALHWQRGRARAAGFDDALFGDAAGRVLEGPSWNIGFFDGDAVVWPQGPALHGVTGRLLREGLAEAGVAGCEREVALAEVAGFEAAFICNARGLRMVGGIDAVRFQEEPAIGQVLRRALAGRPWQAL